MKLLSLIIPAYNEEDNVEHCYEVLSELMNKNSIRHEFVFIDDGSADSTWNIIQRMAEEKDNVTALKFSKNFGKESAIYAGLKNCTGDCCIVMDCDLQHPPETAVEMYRIWETGEYQVVEGRKESRGKESFLYKIFANAFYSLLKSSAGIDLHGMSDFKLLDRQVIDVLTEMPEKQTFFRAMPCWTGFNTTSVYYKVAPRYKGISKWSKRKLFKFALNNISNFSSMPMQIVTVFGVIFFIFAVILGAQTLIRKLMGRSAEGFSTVILLLLMIGSIIMFSLGIIGFYIAKIYEEVKNRPKYIISRRVDKKKSEGSVDGK
jgi:glycosyltransferase involved in cell wall biosynthesis